MKLKIKETGERKELFYGNGNVDMASDYVWNHDDATYDSEDEIAVMTQDAYDFWKEYFKNKETDDERIEAIVEKYDIDKDEIISQISEEFNDLEDEHSVTESILDEIENQFNEWVERVNDIREELILVSKGEMINDTNLEKIGISSMTEIEEKILQSAIDNVDGITYEFDGESYVISLI